MTKAFVDTTILTNVTLKTDASKVAASNALRRYAQSLLPVYAIKEFKNGALRNYIWFHNKILATPKWSDAVMSIQKISGTPMRYKTSTALQALAEFSNSMENKSTDAFRSKYKTNGEMMRSEAQIWLKTLIFRAWKKRRKITTAVVEPLSCYKEVDPKILTSGAIDGSPHRCGVRDCCLRADFRGRLSELNKLKVAADQMDDRAETIKRRRALKHLVSKPNRDLDENDCRALGDAVFVLQCPSDAVILSTNIRDFQPLAAALGKTVSTP